MKEVLSEERLRNDLHVHSDISLCGQHGYFVLYREARRFGLDSIAITDHGPDLGGDPIPSTWLDYQRTPAEMEGVRVFRGIEANLRIDGTTDVPKMYEKQLDLVLLGLHATKDNQRTYKYLPPKQSVLLFTGAGENYYTERLLDAINRGGIDIITHPSIKKFPLCMDAVVEACKEKGIALEFNNSIIILKRKYSPEKTKELIDAVNKYTPRIVISSDAHCYKELGRMDGVKRVLREHPIEAEVELVNATLESTEAFVKERKALRQK